MSALLTRVRDALHRRHAASTVADTNTVNPPEPVWSDPMGRTRGTMKMFVERDGYFSDVWMAYVSDENGDLVSSSVGGGLHAPMFDIDLPVQRIAAPDGFTGLRVDGARRRRVRRGLRLLVRDGHLTREMANMLRQQITADIRASGPVGTVDVFLPGTVRIFPSRTDGHFHVYLDSAPMTMRASTRLAKGTGIVDREFIKASHRRWALRLPDPALWNQPL